MSLIVLLHAYTPVPITSLWTELNGGSSTTQVSSSASTPSSAVWWRSSAEGCVVERAGTVKKWGCRPNFIPSVLHRLPTPFAVPVSTRGGERTPTRHPPTAALWCHESRSTSSFTTSPLYAHSHAAERVDSLSLSLRVTSSTVLRSKEDFNVRRHGSFGTLANPAEARWHVDNGPSRALFFDNFVSSSVVTFSRLWGLCAVGSLFLGGAFSR